MDGCFDFVFREHTTGIPHRRWPGKNSGVSSLLGRCARWAIAVYWRVSVRMPAFSSDKSCIAGTSLAQARHHQRWEIKAAKTDFYFRRLYD